MTCTLWKNVLCGFLMRGTKEGLTKLRVTTHLMEGSGESWIGLLSCIGGMNRLTGAHVDLAYDDGCRVGGPISDHLVGPEWTLHAQIARAISYLQSNDMTVAQKMIGRARGPVERVEVRSYSDSEEEDLVYSSDLDNMSADGDRQGENERANCLGDWQYGRWTWKHVSD